MPTWRIEIKPTAHPLLGALFETAMVHEIRKLFYPFEIKLTANPTRRDASGINAFREAHPKIKVGKGAILCAVERPLWITEDVAAIPWNQA